MGNISPPRVLFVNHTSQLGGAELVLLDIVPSFTGRSCAWLFEDGPLRGRLESAGIKTIMPKRTRSLRAIRRDQSLIKALPMLDVMGSMTRGIAAAAHQYDVVYANSQKAFVLSSVAARLARRPLVWHLHDILNQAHFGLVQRRLVVVLANRFATRVIVPSSSAALAFVEAGGRSELVREIPNGVTVSHEDTSDRAVLRTTLGLPKGFLFGVFSRIAPWKGQHVALQALARLPQAFCVMAGDALFGEVGYTAYLRRIAVELGVAERVQFLGHRNDVPRLMRAVDVVVHTSVDPEPFGRTLVEAMLCRTPVIATHTGASSEILASGAAGLLVPPGDPEALAQALHTINEPALAALLVEAGETRARGHFTVVRMRNEVEAVAREMSRCSRGH